MRLPKHKCGNDPSSREFTMNNKVWHYIVCTICNVSTKTDKPYTYKQALDQWFALNK